MTSHCQKKADSAPRPFAVSRSAEGRRFWRSLEELAESPDFPARLRDEFPAWAAVWDDPLGRRRFMQLMGASLALAGMTGCIRQPLEKIVPQVRSPQRHVPGKPLFFATAMPQEHGLALGLLVESHLGRPTKVEGNPDHPASLGATNAFAQASVLELYDPFRSQVVTFDGGVSTWSSFFADLNQSLRKSAGEGGRHLRVLTTSTTSPSFAAQMADVLELYPQARWHRYEPLARDAAVEANRLAFDEDVHTHYRFDKASRVVSIGCDFLTTGAAAVRYSHDFAQSRRPYDFGNQPRRPLSRLYVVESTPTNTGAMADHCLLVPPAEMEQLALALGQELGLQLRDSSQLSLDARARLWITTMAEDLRAHQGSSIVLAGADQPPLVQAVCHAINQHLANTGNTVVHTAPVHASAGGEVESLRELVADMRAGEVQLLLILGGNPVYDAPVDFEFGELLQKVPFRAHLALYEDETSALCRWHLPQAHYLESWDDVRAFDGTASIVQPLIAPLYSGRTPHDVIAALRGKPDQTTFQLLREYWRSQYGGEDFERYWQQSVHDGVLADTRFAEKQVRLVGDFANRVQQRLRSPEPTPADEPSFTLVFRPDPTVLDGRHATNGWLQELPKPLTRLTWDNAFFISPAAAERLNLGDGDVVELSCGQRRQTGPIFRLPGQPEECITLHLGYGRRDLKLPGASAGINAYVLRTSETPWCVAGARLQKLATSYPLAGTQGHQRMENRDLVRWASADDFEQDPDFAQRGAPTPAAEETLYPQWRFEGYAWGMTIDLNSCTGCAACVVACQAENNIPIVGKTEVLRQREMHWLRIDRYYEGDGAQPLATHFEPVLCMQCEHAPCEAVCPVEATAHSAEGLNDMVYNRCVGTRYCSNNCPYKVRRFNFLQYANFGEGSAFWPQGEGAPLRLMYNPEVTVRSRGVMEKCTYCVQRITAGKIEAELANRKVRDGEIRTACQAACPSQAIVFGDTNDQGSLVSRLKQLPLNYGLLTELNTRPRTTYLAKVKNLNPRLVAALAEASRA
jgi:molybdopterin-containing oxidoreductase family iron-sulfur binding subunit